MPGVIRELGINRYQDGCIFGSRSLGLPIPSNLGGPTGGFVPDFITGWGPICYDPETNLFTPGWWQAIARDQLVEIFGRRKRWVLDLGFNYHFPHIDGGVGEASGSFDATISGQSAPPGIYSGGPIIGTDIMEELAAHTDAGNLPDSERWLPHGMPPDIATRVNLSETVYLEASVEWAIEGMANGFTTQDGGLSALQPYGTATVAPPLFLSGADHFMDAPTVYFSPVNKCFYAAPVITIGLSWFYNTNPGETVGASWSSPNAKPSEVVDGIQHLADLGIDIPIHRNYSQTGSHEPMQAYTGITTAFEGASFELYKCKVRAPDTGGYFEFKCGPGNLPVWHKDSGLQLRPVPITL